MYEESQGRVKIVQTVWRMKGGSMMKRNEKREMLTAKATTKRKLTGINKKHFLARNQCCLECFKH